jgi:hypothetical protein
MCFHPLQLQELHKRSWGRDIVNSLFVSFYKMLIDIGLFPHALWAQRSCLGSTVVPWPFQHMSIN